MFDQTTGTLYLAAHSDAAGAEERIAETSTPGPTTVVGLFRTQREKVDSAGNRGAGARHRRPKRRPGQWQRATCRLRHRRSDLRLDGDGARGAHDAELLINNDDPHTPRISLPVEMMVAEVPSILDVTYSTAGFEVTFDAAVTGTAPLTYTWAFGDGGTSGVEDPTHVYAHGGCYTPTLTLTNGYCQDTWQEQICLYRTYYLPIVVKSP